MTTSTAAQSAGVSYRKLLFTYDWMGRRVRKQVFTSSTATASGAYVPCYDGNGNVVNGMECQNLEQVVTRQEYDPFGNITVHDGL
ncbi:hypothetical protein JIN85_08025 [Luteolibacter pohnpeiensis]|uniref:RHS repeat protein n=1 Tax=Luteolibacter pohnpeiensis TaxID=454153 RepID=A0A934S9Y4_9BACT|nr:hypothetical protein [Luteolibacter pohnpeiensis]MBK1882357.1 hypothetical protein [Luteolibacter pohnpeiensis]